MTIIGLSGRKKSGKDTVCEMIQQICGGQRFAFADALKYELSAATGVSVDQIETNKDRFRLGLQWWGTEFRRFDSESYWVDKLEQRITESGCELAIVTDCRFKNEADKIREMGGIVIRINRDSCLAGDAHLSETSMDDYDYDEFISNNGSLFELQAKVRMILQGFYILQCGHNGFAQMGSGNGSPEMGRLAACSSAL